MSAGKAGEIPTGWTATPSGPGAVGRANAYFYKKLQYRGSVNHAKRNKHQPLPQSRNILSQSGVNRENS